MVCIPSRFSVVRLSSFHSPFRITVPHFIHPRLAALKAYSVFSCMYSYHRMSGMLWVLVLSMVHVISHFGQCTCVSIFPSSIVVHIENVSTAVCILSIRPGSISNDVGVGVIATCCPVDELADDDFAFCGGAFICWDPSGNDGSCRFG